MWVICRKQLSTPITRAGTCRSLYCTRAVSSTTSDSCSICGSSLRSAIGSVSVRKYFPSTAVIFSSGSNSENMCSTSRPNPFITLSTQTMAAVTTHTAAALTPDTMLMALCPFFEKRYRHAICRSTLLMLCAVLLLLCAVLLSLCAVLPLLCAVLLLLCAVWLLLCAVLLLLYYSSLLAGCSLVGLPSSSSMRSMRSMVSSR